MKKNTKNFAFGLIQMACSPSPAENQSKAEIMVKEAAKAGAQVICLPELYRTQYFCQKEDIKLFNLAEPIPGPSTKAFQAIAKKHKVVIIASLFEKRAAGLYHNTAVVINNDGSIAGIYRKMHIPDDPAYYEKFYFTPGDLGFKAIDTAHGKIGTLVCWDQWFPEGARLTALQGAPILCYPTAIGWHPYEKKQYGAQQRDAWMTVQRGHAIANGCYVAGVNRTGFEQPVKEQAGIEFWGSSFIADPQGVILAQASTDKEEVIIADIDIDHLEDIRRNWPYLRDRRIDAYSDITKRFID
jgi:N-carbamoylputrescine amidase